MIAVTHLIVLLFGGIVAYAADIVPLSEKLDILKNTYPDVIKDIQPKLIILQDGTSMQIDDGITKDHQTKLKKADIEDSLSQIYPIGACFKGPPNRNFDPGRIRNEQFMRLLYGRTESKVRGNLAQIAWFGSRTLFNKRNAAADALKLVSGTLEKLPKKYAKYFNKTGGTFNWRMISKTKRLSVHSFGAAIDINTKYANYWRWAGGKPGKVPKYQNQIPREIVAAFEKHGFIWGGKWYHFDTMHFEYRPELIAIGKLAEDRGCAQ